MSTIRRPNVIWVLADQLRGQALSLYGDPNVRTPNVDRLAHEGRHFPHAVSGTPLCTPARGSFLTGRYPHNSTAPTHDSPLDSSCPTVANVFRDAGYRTCYIGKWHLDGRERAVGEEPGYIEARTRIIPRDRRGGFQDWFGFEFSNRPFDTYVNVDGPDGSTTAEKVDGYQTDGLTDILLDWIERRDAEAPFFAVLSVEPPHSPYTAPADAMAGHTPAGIRFRPNVPEVDGIRRVAAAELAGYYAAIERLDHNLGRIREALDAAGIADDTYIVFFSDHGDLHGSHGQFRKTAPWNEAIRIPLVIGGPSIEHQELEYAEIDALVNHVDIAPTTLGLCGIAMPDWMEGHDFSPRVLEENWHDSPVPADEPDAVYLSLPIPTGHEHSVDREYRGIITRDGWKYVSLAEQPWLMFHLTDDPYEQVNLAHNPRWAVERARLNGQLAEWVARTGDTFAVPELA